jgi:hypothetical protein
MNQKVHREEIHREGIHFEEVRREIIDMSILVVLTNSDCHLN